MSFTTADVQRWRELRDEVWTSSWWAAAEGAKAQLAAKVQANANAYAPQVEAFLATLYRARAVFIGNQAILQKYPAKFGPDVKAKHEASGERINALLAGVLANAQPVDPARAPTLGAAPVVAGVVVVVVLGVAIAVSVVGVCWAVVMAPHSVAELKFQESQQLALVKGVDPSKVQAPGATPPLPGTGLLPPVPDPPGGGGGLLFGMGLAAAGGLALLLVTRR